MNKWKIVLDKRERVKIRQYKNCQIDGAWIFDWGAKFDNIIRRKYFWSTSTQTNTIVEFINCNRKGCEWSKLPAEPES